MPAQHTHLEGFPLARTNRFKNSFIPWGVRKFKGKFSTVSLVNCHEHSFSYFTVWYVEFTVLLSFCRCHFNLTAIKSYLTTDGQWADYCYNHSREAKRSQIFCHVTKSLNNVLPGGYIYSPSMPLCKSIGLVR